MCDTRLHTRASVSVSAAASDWRFCAIVEGKMSKSLFFCCHVLLFFLLPVPGKIPVVLFLLLLFEPLWIVCELWGTLAMLASYTYEDTYKISSAHTATLASGVLHIFCFLHCFLLCFLLVHPSSLPYREGFRRYRREVSTQFMSLEYVQYRAKLDGVEDRPTSTSKNSSKLMTLAFSASSAALR